MGERKWNKEIIILLLPAFIFISIFFIYPFIYGLYLSFTSEGGTFTIQNYSRFFTDWWEYRTIGVTLQISLPTTIVSVLFSIPLAYYMRRGMKGERIITFFLILPITLGAVLIAQGMLTFYGPQGWFNKILMEIGIIKEPLRLTHNKIGVMLSLIMQSFPFSFLLLLGYISGINPDLEKAAKMLGATWWQVFWKVMFPLMSPGIAIAFALNFVMAFSVFPTAVLLGEPSGPTRVIGYAAYQWAYEKFNFHMGSAITLIMGVIELLIVGLILWWRSLMYRGASIGGKG